MSSSSQKFIARNRAPRVQIEYDVELYGAQKKVQLPFVMGVMSGLSGNPTEPLPAGGDGPQGRRAERADGGAPAADEPGDLHGRQVGRRAADWSGAEGSHLVEDAGVDGEAGRRGLRRGEEVVMAAEVEKQTEAAAGTTVEAGDFASLMQKQIKPQSDRARDEVESAVKTLAQHALEKTALIGADVVESINAMIAEIDRKMSEQVNVILHHPDYQQLESAWRGLHHLVNNTETDEMLKILLRDVHH